MKKFFFILGIVALTSCDSSLKEAQQFAEELSNSISTGDTATLFSIYPEAVKADSLALKYVADSLKVETSSIGDTLVIRFATDIFITTIKDTDGKLRAIASHGIFAYPQERMDFALKTGWYNKKLDDIKNADRLADTLFVKYLNDKIAGTIIADLKSKVRVTKSVATHDLDNLKGLCTVVVSNQNGRQIEGNEYVVTAKLYDVTGFFYTRGYCGSRKLTGKPIAANGQAIYSFSYDVGGYPIDPVCTISVNPKIENVLADYQPTGKEYEEYLSQKAK